MPKGKPNKVKVKYRKLGRERAWGQAMIGENFIEVDPRLDERRMLRVITHELCHLAFPNASETQVLEAEKIVGQTLWDLGYRKQN